MTDPIPEHYRQRAEALMMEIAAKAEELLPFIQELGDKAEMDNGTVKVVVSRSEIMGGDK